MTRNLDELEQVFDLCLEQIKSGQTSLDSALAQHPGQAAELRPRLEAALWLDERKESLDPTPEFIAASRKRLISQIKDEPLAKPVVVEAPAESLLLQWWRQFVSQGLGAKRRYAFQLAIIVIFLFTTVFGGRQVAYASQDAIPGDPLYPVKITLESVEMVATLDLAEEIRLHAEFARTRLIEAQELVLEGRFAYIPDTLARFGEHVDQAVSKLETLAMRDAGKALTMTAYLHESLSDQVVVLDALMGVVPLALQPEITRALKVTGGAIMTVEEIDTQSGGGSLVTPTPQEGIEEDSTFGLETDTPSATLTTTTSPSSTSTLIPSETPTAPASATLTAEVPSSTPVPAITRTPDSGGGDRESDPTKPPPPTDEPPTDEPQPENTKKPKPSPTRRPPKPTQESKVTKVTQEVEPTQTGN